MSNISIPRKFVAAAALAVSAIGVFGAASPASAAMSDWEWICNYVGGTYYNTAWGELCVVDGDYLWAD